MPIQCPQNGQMHIKNLSLCAAKFLMCVRPFCGYQASQREPKTCMIIFRLQTKLVIDVNHIYNFYVQLQKYRYDFQKCWFRESRRLTFSKFSTFVPQHSETTNQIKLSRHKSSSCKKISHKNQKQPLHVFCEKRYSQLCQGLFLKKVAGLQLY